MTPLSRRQSLCARDLMVQEVGFARLQELGVKLIAADSPTAFLDDTPTAKLVRQLLGAVSEFDKTMLVAKLKAARDRKIAKGQTWFRLAQKADDPPSDPSKDVPSKSG
jgi:DNA invertase Pin-like site-specific DNA recombinase